MRKFASALLALLFVAGLAACHGSGSSNSNDCKPGDNGTYCHP